MAWSSCCAYRKYQVGAAVQYAGACWNGARAPAVKHHASPDAGGERTSAAGTTPPARTAHRARGGRYGKYYLGGVVGARDEGALGPRLGAAGVQVNAGAGDVPHGGELQQHARTAQASK